VPSFDSNPRAAAWHALEAHAARIRDGLAAVPAEGIDPQSALEREACGLFLDCSRQRVDAQGLERLEALARASDLETWRDRMFRGEVVNETEGRAALHVALRQPADGESPAIGGDAVLAEVEAVRERMEHFSSLVRDGTWRGFGGERIRHLVNIGIGGSDLGPAMICRALDHLGHDDMTCHFVSNLDSNDLASVLENCEPGRTLFLIASKTFSTQETLTNARSAREWLLAAAGGDDAAVAKHFVAMSTALDRCADFGIPETNVFGFWDWVGGRYSLWSAIGLSIAIYLGMPVFRALHRGGHAMDCHFQAAPLKDNLPVLLALVGIWNRNLRGQDTLAILPYDHPLELFPAFLQQLEMESNGKGVDRAGRPLERPAAPVIWGASGNNGQHAFYQLLHQGLDTVPVDLLVAAHGQRPLPGHEMAVLANALAQAEVFSSGRTLDATRAELEARGIASSAVEAVAPHMVMPGGRPVTVILYERLTPEVLGALVALYEHKVFVQAVCWDINPFDQYGVELGKKLARALEPVLESGTGVEEHDASTRRLVQRVRSMRGLI
jgi:glucose-6-phosphate isomerase